MRGGSVYSPLAAARWLGRWSGQLRKALGAAGLILAVAGCAYTPLVYPQPVYRPNLPLRPITVKPPAVTRAGTAKQPAIPPVSGTYSFTLPASVSGFKSVQGRRQQYRLYLGAGVAGRKPFVTITVAPRLRQVTKADPNFPITSQAQFLFHGLRAREWTGYTPAQEPFTELMLSHGGGEQLDALAVAGSRAERRAAMAILESIRWQAGAGAAPEPSTPGGHTETLR